MSRSLFSRLFGSFVAIILLVTAAYVAVTFTAVRDSYLNTLTGDLNTLAITLSEQIGPLIDRGQLNDVQALAARIDQRIHRRITVILPDGSIMADSEKNPSLMENHRGRPEVGSALAGNIGRSVRFSTTVKEDMLYVAVPLSSGRQGRYIIRVSMFLRDFNALLRQVKLQVMKTAGIIMLLALAGAILVSRALARPLKELQTAAETMAEGDFSARVSIRSSKEIAALGSAFNAMAAKINGLFSELSGRTEEVNTILSAIRESLFVIAKDGRVLMANDSFKQLCGQSSAEGRYYWELFREPAFEALIKQSMAAARHMTGSFGHGGRSYLCGISKLPARDEYVVLLQDMTEEKKLETIKKDFVTNVSHELRTPLTAIKGFVETLDDMVSGEGKRYLGIISRHTDRLIHIVEDLLTLSEAENPLFKLELRPHDLKAIIEDIALMFQPRAGEKNIRLSVNAPARPRAVMVDASKFEQVLINLVDNAIKYTERGEIVISLREEGLKAVVSVADTGPGIPKELLGRIFERFFVVDSSRSRKLGGTGLGLSIVKHIVNLHGGSIDVSSVPGKGSTFTIILPGTPA